MPRSKPLTRISRRTPAGSARSTSARRSSSLEASLGAAAAEHEGAVAAGRDEARLLVAEHQLHGERRATLGIVDGGRARRARRRRSRRRGGRGAPRGRWIGARGRRPPPGRGRCRRGARRARGRRRGRRRRWWRCRASRPPPRRGAGACRGGWRRARARSRAAGLGLGAAIARLVVVGAEGDAAARVDEVAAAGDEHRGVAVDDAHAQHALGERPPRARWRPRRRW